MIKNILKTKIIVIIFSMIIMTSCFSDKYIVNRLDSYLQSESDTFAIYIDSYITMSGFGTAYNYEFIDNLKNYPNLYKSEFNNAVDFLNDNDFHKLLNKIQDSKNYYPLVVDSLKKSGKKAIDVEPEIVTSDKILANYSKLCAIVTDGRSLEISGTINQLWEKYDAVSIYIFKSAYTGKIYNPDDQSQFVDLSESYVDSYYYVIVFGDYKSVLSFDQLFTTATTDCNRITKGIRKKSIKEDSQEVINKKEMPNSGNSRLIILSENGDNFENMAVYRVGKSDDSITFSFDVNELLQEGNNYNVQSFVEKYIGTNSFESVEYNPTITFDKGIVSVTINSKLPASLYRVTYEIYERGTLSKIKDFINEQNNKNEYIDAKKFYEISKSAISDVQKKLDGRNKVLAYREKKPYGFHVAEGRNQYIAETEDILSFIKKKMLINNKINFGTLPSEQSNSLFGSIIELRNNQASVVICERVFYIHVV